jgi:hypothetical protein
MIITNLDDGDQVEKTIQRAAKGDSSAAWFLIHQIENALKSRTVSAPLFDHAARFFGALLDLHDEGRERPQNLVKAYETLYIIRSLGQPKRDDFEKHLLASRVLLLKRAGYAVDVALIGLGTTQLPGETAYSHGAYTSAFYEPKDEPLGQQLDRFAEASELESLAEITSKDLVAALEHSGALLPKKRRKK